MSDPQLEQSASCHFHPDRRAGVSCQRCGKQICPSCMSTASVGFHCPDCSRTGRQQAVRPPSFSGGRATTPLATTVLIGVNVVMFLLLLASGASAFDGAGGDLDIDLGLVGGGLVGSRLSPEFIGVDDGEWYRLVTGAFLHAGIIHLGFNMFLLWMLGQQLERSLGVVPYLSIYSGGLFGGSFGALLLDPNALTVGASGAVFGLMAAFVVIQLRAGVNPFDTGIGGLLVLNLLFTFLRPGISIGGHIGGLVAGGLATLFVLETRDRMRNVWVGVGANVGLSVLLAFAGVWAAGNWLDPPFG